MPNEFVVGPSLPGAPQPVIGKGTIGTTNDILPAFFQYFATHKPGDVIKWAGGTLTMRQGPYNYNIAHYSGNGYEYDFTALTPLSKIATDVKPIGVLWAEEFGFHP